MVSSADFYVMGILGAGGFGKVALVRKHDSGVIYAMKVMEKAKVLRRGRVSVQQIYEIASLKIKDFEKKHKRVPLRTLARSLVCQCRSMGLQVYLPAGSAVKPPDFIAAGAAVKNS